MFRKNKQTKPPGGPPRLHFGIRPKMMLGLLVVFIGCTLALQVILTRQLSQSMEDQIESDLMRLQSTTQVYTRQIMLLGGAEEVTDLAAVESEVVQTLVEELYAASGDTLAVYSMTGPCCGLPRLRILTNRIFRRRRLNRPGRDMRL